MEKTSLQDWIGGSETAADLISPERCIALARALDRADSSLVPGAPLPPLRHWLYFWSMATRARLGRDGHPALGEFLPDVGRFWNGAQTRRMWAGSRIAFHHPLPLGRPARRMSTIEDVVEKSGRSGRLAFVTVRHEVYYGAALCITDRHDIVYREEKPGAALSPPEPAPTDQQWDEGFVADPVLLFRYSALTFNGHRIHYDRDYARDVEGYDSLVVHGPLLATLLVDFAGDAMPDRVLRSFSFRGRRPVIDGRRFSLCGRMDGDDVLKLWIADIDGALAMTAEAVFS